MTDFLSKLVTRTLGIAPTAQPLITPMYTPEATTPESSLLPGATTSQRPPTLLPSRGESTIDEPGQKAARHPTIANEQFPYVASLAPAERPPTESTIRQAESLHTTEMPDNRLVQPNHAAQQPVNKRQTESQPTQLLVEHQPTSQANTRPRDQEATYAQPLRPDEQAAQPVERNTAVDMSFVAPALSRPQVAIRADEAAMIVEPKESQGRATAESRKVKSDEPRHPQPNQVFQQREATPPTIQVTIGRIEVRAIQPAVAAQPRPAPKPSLSLEEYLRTQKGGR
ncbi:hypothetical protein BH10CHL1_BH10CHL1_42540 [soil metagenome]